MSNVCAVHFCEECVTFYFNKCRIAQTIIMDDNSLDVLRNVIEKSKLLKIADLYVDYSCIKDIICNVENAHMNILRTIVRFSSFSVICNLSIIEYTCLLSGLDRNNTPSYVINNESEEDQYFQNEVK
jgi:hypothetical protein